MRKSTWLLFIFCSVLCFAADPTFKQPTEAELIAMVPTSPVDHCAGKKGLPDEACTPGVVLTINKDYICHGVSTKKIRPPSSYTNLLKSAQIIEYGWEDADPGDYEEDHLVSLEIGGHPYDPKNLWPEPHGGRYGSVQKDKVENWLHKQICKGTMTVEEAQNGVRTNWRQYLKNVTPYKPPKVKETE